MKYDLEPRGWIVAEETFDPCRTAKCESIFAQGNGYINIRWRRVTLIPTAALLSRAHSIRLCPMK